MAIDKITADGIADNAIGTSKIGADVIVAEDIAANAITVAEISDDAVTTAKIADLGVTHAKLHTSMDLSSKTVTLPSLASLAVTGDFTVDTNTLFVDASADAVGVNTTTPTQTLHVVSSSAAAVQVEGPTRADLFLVDSGAGTDQKRKTIRSDDGSLGFGTENDAINSYTEHMRLDSSNNLLIAKTTSNADTAGHEFLNYGRAVHTVDASTVQVLNRLNNDGDVVIFQRDGTTVGSVSQANSSATYNTNSDERLKENIKSISDGVEKLMAMNPVTFTWKKYPDDPSQHGFIAQEMEKILPEAVTSSEYMSMDYGRITPILVAALQDALKRIQELEEKINVSK